MSLFPSVEDGGASLSLSLSFSLPVKTEPSRSVADGRRQWHDDDSTKWDGVPTSQAG